MYKNISEYRFPTTFKAAQFESTGIRLFNAMNVPFENISFSLQSYKEFLTLTNDTNIMVTILTPLLLSLMNVSI